MTMTEDGNVLAALFAKLSVSIDNLTTAHERRERREAAAKKAEQPSYNQIQGSVVLNSNGYGVIRFDLAGPNQGYVWHLKSLAIGGSDPTVTVDGRADIYVLASDIRQTQSIAELGLGGWRDSITALPAVGSYGEGECFLHANEELWIVISGGTSGQPINAIATVQNVQEAANKQSTAL